MSASWIERITVDDRGPGIAPEERAAVFERFHRSTVTAKDGTRGTGLGLALVAEHAALHGGGAWAEAAPGGGARFVVELAQRREQRHRERNVHARCS